MIGCAINVHRELGPGLVESIYEPCLAQEFTDAGLEFQRQVGFTVTYKGLVFERAFRADFVVENELILEIKSTAALDPVHSGQILTYMRLSRLRKGLLINFNVPVLKAGIKSFVL